MVSELVSSEVLRVKGGVVTCVCYYRAKGVELVHSISEIQCKTFCCSVSQLDIDAAMYGYKWGSKGLTSCFPPVIDRL